MSLQEDRKDIWWLFAQAIYIGAWVGAVALVILAAKNL